MKLLKFKNTLILTLVMLFSLGFSYVISSQANLDSQFEISSKNYDSVKIEHKTHFSENTPSSDQRSPIENKIENNEDETKDDLLVSNNSCTSVNKLEKHTRELNGVKLKHAAIESDNFKSVSIPFYILFQSWKIDLV